MAAKELTKKYPPSMTKTELQADQQRMLQQGWRAVGPAQLVFEPMWTYTVFLCVLSFGLGVIVLKSRRQFPLKRGVWLVVFRQGEIDEVQARQLLWTKLSKGRQEAFLVITTKRDESPFAFLLGWRYMGQDMNPVIVDKVTGRTYVSKGDLSGVLRRYDSERLKPSAR